MQIWDQPFSTILGVTKSQNSMPVTGQRVGGAVHSNKNPSPTNHICDDWETFFYEGVKKLNDTFEMIARIRLILWRASPADGTDHFCGPLERTRK